MEVRDDVLKSLDTARNEKLIGAPLEARVRLSADGELLPAAASSMRARTAGAVHRVAGGVEPGAAGGELGVTDGARGRARSASAAGSTPRTSASIAKFPTVCAACADAVDEMSEWLISG